MLRFDERVDMAGFLASVTVTVGYIRVCRGRHITGKDNVGLYIIVFPECRVVVRVPPSQCLYRVVAPSLTLRS